MSDYIVKPVREQDWYFVYNTVVDAPVQWGSRAELEAESDPAAAAAERFERANRLGTSCLVGKPRIGGWHQKEFRVMEGPVPDCAEDEYAALARGDVRKYCEALAREDEAAAAAMCTIRSYE